MAAHGFILGSIETQAFSKWSGYRTKSISQNYVELQHWVLIDFSTLQSVIWFIVDIKNVQV